MRRLNLIPYVGGKSFLLKNLLPLIPPHKIYVEVFGGGAALLLNKPPSGTEVYNDIDSELVNLFMIIRSNPAEFRHRLNGLPYSRELFQRWSGQFKMNDLPQDPVERALRFYYVASSSMSGKFGHGWSFGRTGKKWRRTMLNRKLEAIHSRLINVIIDHLDFRACIKNWDSSDTFFFLDPPYYDRPKELYRYPITERDHIDLAAILKQTLGKWLLTYGDHPHIRKLYGGHLIRKVESYSYCQKISRRNGESKRGKHNHLLIMNYSPPPVREPLKELKPLLLFEPDKISAKEMKSCG